MFGGSLDHYQPEEVEVGSQKFGKLARIGEVRRSAGFFFCNMMKLDIYEISFLQLVSRKSCPGVQTCPRKPANTVLPGAVAVLEAAVYIPMKRRRTG